MSTGQSHIRRSISAIVVLTVLGLAVGESAYGQVDIQPRQIAAIEVEHELPVWEPHVAMGPSRAVAVFNVGRARYGPVQLGYAVYSLTQNEWIAQGLIDEAAGTSIDGTVQWYDLQAGQDGSGEDQEEDDDGPGGAIPVRGFIACGIVYTAPDNSITVAHMGASSTAFSTWRTASRPQNNPGVDWPSLVKGNSSGSELYIVYFRLGPKNFGYVRSRDYGVTWFPNASQLEDADVIKVDDQPVVGEFPPYGAAVSAGNFYMAYNTSDGLIGLLEGVDIDDPGDPNFGGVRFDYVRESYPHGQPLRLTRNRVYYDFAPALPCISRLRPGGWYSEPHLAVAPGLPTTLYVVYQDTATADPEDLDINVYLVRVTRQEGGWVASEPVRVNTEDAFEDDDQFLPTPPVDSAGRIHVIYYDDRHYEQPDQTQECSGYPWDADLDVFWNWSTDGGESFQQQDWELCLNPDEDCDRDGIASPMALDFSRRLYEFYHFGEYMGISSYGNRMMAVFAGTARPILHGDFVPDQAVIWATRIDFAP